MAEVTIRRDGAVLRDGNWAISVPGEERPNRRQGVTPVVRLTIDDWTWIGKQMGWRLVPKPGSG
jgi:hypothetical protein